MSICIGTTNPLAKWVVGLGEEQSECVGLYVPLYLFDIYIRMSFAVYVSNLFIFPCPRKDPFILKSWALLVENVHSHVMIAYLERCHIKMYWRVLHLTLLSFTSVSLLSWKILAFWVGGGVELIEAAQSGLSNHTNFRTHRPRLHSVLWSHNLHAHTHKQMHTWKQLPKSIWCGQASPTSKGCPSYSGKK